MHYSEKYFDKPEVYYSWNATAAICTLPRSALNQNKWGSSSYPETTSDNFTKFQSEVLSGV